MAQAAGITLSLFLFAGLGVWLTIRGDLHSVPPRPEAGSPGHVDEAASLALKVLGPVKDSAARESIISLDTDVRRFLNGTTTMPDPESKEVVALIDRIVTLRRQHPGTPEAIHAAGLQRALPAAADKLPPEAVDPYELEALLRTVIARGVDLATGAPLQRNALDAARRQAVDRLQMPASQVPVEQRQQAAAALRPPELVALYGNSRWSPGSSVFDLAWSPDDQWIVSSGSSSQLYLWNADTGEVEWAFETEEQVLAVEYAGSGHIAATAKSGALYLLDAQTGRQKWQIKAHASGANVRGIPPRAMPLAAGRQDTLLTGGLNGRLKCWNLADGSSRWEVDVSQAGLSRLRHDLEHHLIVCGDASGRLFIYEWQNEAQPPKLRSTIEAHELPVDAIAIHPEGSVIASASGDPNDQPTARVLVHDASTGEPVATIPAGHRVVAMDFEPSGRRLALSGWIGEKHTTLFDTTTWMMDRRLKTSGEGLKQNVQYAMRFSRDGKRLAQGGYYGAISVFSLNPDQLIPSCAHTQFRTVPVNSVVCTPDGRVSGSLNHGFMESHSLSTAQSLGRVDDPARLPDKIWRAACSFDGQSFLAVSEPNKKIVQWDARDPSRWFERTLNEHDAGVSAFAPSPASASTFITGSFDGTVRLWEGGLIDAPSVRIYQGHGGRIESIAFNADGTRFASAAGKTVRLWQPSRSEPFETLRCDGGVTAVAFHPATGELFYSDGSRVQIYDASRAHHRGTLSGITQQIHSIEISPDGTRVAAAGMDSMLYVWDNESLDPVTRFPIGPAFGSINDLKITPDSRHILCGKSNGTVAVFRLTEWSPNLITTVPRLSGTAGKPAPPSPEAGSPGHVDEAASLDSRRAIVREALGLGAQPVNVILSNGNRRDVTSEDQISLDDFRIVGVRFYRVSELPEDKVLQLLESLPEIEIIRFEHCPTIGDQLLEKLDGWKNLNSLSLTETGCTAEPLLRLLSKSAIVSLKVEADLFTTSVADLLSERDMDGVHINGGSEVHWNRLVDLKSASQLETVGFTGASLNNEQWSQLTRFRNLKVLHVTSSNIGDIHLATLKELPAIAQIGLTNTEVTDAGLLTLAQVPTLDQLELKHTNVTTTGVQKLHTSLPRCTIIWDEGSPGHVDEAASLVPDIANPPPLDEWLEGREILTVAQDGSAMFTTINAALDALKPGQVVEVLDRGPYEESFLDVSVPDDTGLVSRVQTRWVPKWTVHPEISSVIRGAEIAAEGRFRLSGFDIHGGDWADAPKGEERFGLLRLMLRGNSTVDDCRISLEPPPDRPASHGFGLDVTPLADAQVLVRDCVLSTLSIKHEAETRTVTVTRNWFRKYPAGMIALSGSRRGSVLVRENVFEHSSRAPATYFGSGPSVSANVFVFESNTVLTQWLSLQGIPPDEAQLMTLRDNIFAGNVVAGSAYPGRHPVPRHWKVTGNVRLNKRLDENSYELSDTPLVDESMFLTTDRPSRDFGRIRSGSAAVFEDGSYAGALPPGPAPDGGDWFTRLRDRWKDEDE